MGHTNVAREFFYVVLGKDLRDKSHTFVERDALPIGHRDARAFLSSMLECEESEEGESSDFEPLSVDPEDCAFFSE